MNSTSGAAHASPTDGAGTGCRGGQHRHEALTVILEPWGRRHEVAPGERVRVVARGPAGRERPEAKRRPEKVVIYCWRGSLVAVIRGQRQTGADARATATPG